MAVTRTIGYLCEWLGQPFQGELVVAEFTVAAVGRGEPVLQAGAVNHGQGAGALTRGQQLSGAPPLMADPAEWLITAHQDTPDRETVRGRKRVSGMGVSRFFYVGGTLFCRGVWGSSPRKFRK